MITREQLEDARHEQYRIYGYKHAYCKLNDCCENCDKRVRFGCKLICKIEKLQTKRILEVCKAEVKADADSD